MNSLENKGLTVGRAGNDPATYGLKGRISTWLAGLVFRDRASAARNRNPRVNHDEWSVFAPLRRTVSS